MIKAKRADSPGVEDGRVILRFLGDDDKRYDLALNGQATADAIVALLQGATSLAPDERVTIEAVQVAGSFQLALGPKMQPTLLVSIGGATLPIHLTETQLSTLQRDMSELLKALQTKH